ncbi:MAG: SpoIIE family protein phosphatase [Lachnospiraceae bacterium]|nr:SpoIIE family protein phosphatase [Lachnospiraceae bacterium]
MIGIYLKLLIAAGSTALLTAVLYYLEKKTRFGKLEYRTRQVIYGVLFGVAAICGTEYGVYVEGATANVRDAAPLAAGLIFGAPAGIIAGLIGGIERWFSVLWGAGYYTRVACTVSTILAGFYAAYVRVKISGNRRPSVLMGVIVGFVMEAFHLLMILLTHTHDISTALSVVRKITMPMISMCGVSMALSSLAAYAIESFGRKKEKTLRRIEEKVRRQLLVVFLLCFMLFTFLATFIQFRMSEKDTYNILLLNTVDLEFDVEDQLEEETKKTVQVITQTLSRNRNRSLADLVETYGLSEIYVIDTDNMVSASTDLEMIGKNLSQVPEASYVLEAFEYGDTLVLPVGFVSLKNDGIKRKYAFDKMKNGIVVLISINEEQVTERQKAYLNTIVANRHIQNNGYYAIVDEEGNVIANGKGMGSMTAEEYGFSMEDVRDTYSLHEGNLGGEDCYYSSVDKNGLYYIGILQRKEALESAFLIMYLLMFIQMIIYALVYTLIYKLMERIVVNPIRNVNKGLGVIMSGELSERIEEHSSAEFDSLSNDINKTVDTLKDYISEAENRMEKELRLAKNIQSSALPSVFPPFTDMTSYDIFAAMDPAKTVGGDFYDIFRLVGRRVVFLVADVSGKGIPAAMFMMTAKTMIKNLMETGRTPSEAFTEANNKLCEGNEAEMFVTSWMGVLDTLTGHVTYVNAGHNPPLVKRNGGSFEYLKGRPGFVLAGMEGIRYKEFEMTLEPGEKIFLYTDGAPEAVNKDLEQYGEGRLREFMNAHEAESPDRLIPALRADIEAFANGAEQFDDITMLELVYTGETENRA